jgi:antitoxin component YwqK of YwqJK toxin-antitoxin module
MRAAAFWLAWLACVACGPADGTRRPLRVLWPGTGDPPAPRCIGEELRHEGAWVKDGPVVFFDRAGRETQRGAYALGLESGVWTERDRETGLLGKGEYVAGRRHGEWSYFHPSGTLAQRGRYAHGLPDGVWERFEESGARASEVTWVAGKRQGRATYWDEQRRVRTELSGIYENDVRVSD